MYATHTLRNTSHEKERDFDESITEEPLDNFWKIWSGALGHGYLEAITGTKEINKKRTGRRKITMVEMTPNRKDMATSVE